MMANKRNLECMDSFICSKIPRLDNEPNELSGEICKPSPFPIYAQENSLKYTGSYLAYHLRNRDGTDTSGIWSQARPYLQSTSNLSAQSRATDDAHLGNRLNQTELDIPPTTFQRSANEKDKLDLVKDLMNVRSKWVTFVERQKNLRNAPTLSGLLCPAAAGKRALMASTLPAVHNCGNVAFPQPVYRSSICSGVGCSLENSADHFHRRGRETEWRMTTPVTSSCLIANNDQLMHTQQYGNPVLKNKSLPHGPSSAQPSSTDRISKETGSLAGLRSSLCQGYGAYSRNILQDPRYSMLQYGNMPSQASMHSLHNFQKPPLHPYSTSEGQQLQPPFYGEKLSPPKFPMPIQPKVVHSQNTILNQQNPYSLQHPHGYRAQISSCPYTSTQGTDGRIPVATSTFVGQLSSGNPYQQHSESLRYPVHSPPVQKGIPLTGPLIHPGLESGTQPGQLELQSPSRKSAPPFHHDPTNGKLPSSDILHFRPHVIVETQTDKRCYDSLNSLSNKEYIGQHQLISKHSAFQPVLSGKHLKGAFERPAVSPADQRPKDIYMHERHPSIDSSPISNHGILTFSKKNEIVNNKLVDSGLGDSPKSYNISPNRRVLELNFQSPSSSREDERLSASSPPMPVINNVFSLAPYRSYLEATGLFFSRCQKCQSDSNKSLHCSCSSENKTKHFSYAGVMNPDLFKQPPVQLSMGTSELQCKDAELQQSNPSNCTGVTSNEGLSGIHLRKAENEKNSIDIQRQDINLSPNLRIQNVAHQSSSSSTASQEFDHRAGKLGEMTKTDAESALDLSIKNKHQPMDVAQQQFSASCGSEEDQECGEEMKEEEKVSPGESTSNAEGPQRKVDDTPLTLPSGSSESREELRNEEVSNEKQQNTAESESHKRKPEAEAQSDIDVQTAVKTSVASSVVNHSALMLDLNKYKILRPAYFAVDGPNPTHPERETIDATKLNLLGSINPLRLFLRPLKLIMPNEPKSPLSPVPEVKKPPCEIKPSVPSNEESIPNENDSDAYFLSLHRSLCDMIARSMEETSEEVLRACLQDIEMQNRGQENPKLKSSLKSKNITRNSEEVEMSKSQEIWLRYGHVQPTMQKLLSHLETYRFTRECPFPHVIRAGAVFIPIYLVKEKLFPSLKGAMIDQVFQEHKIELRPTTLSEEKKLQSELKLERCSSRLIKLLSLKQLPEIYPDLLNVLWHSCAKLRLGVQNDDELKKIAVTPNPAGKSGHKDQQTDSGSGGKKKKVKSRPPVKNPSSNEEKPEDGITVPRLGVKLRKRLRNDKVSSCVNSNPVCINSASSSSSANNVNSSSVDHSEKSCPTEPEQNPCAVELSKDPRPTPRKLCRGTKEILEERVRNTFGKRDSALVVKLNRVVIKNDSNGTDIPRPVMVKEPQTVAKKNPAALRLTRSTSKVHLLRGSIVRLKFHKPVKTTPCRNIILRPITTRKPLLTRNSQRLDQKKGLRPLSLRNHQENKYPNLVGKHIRHLYEENDKSESWYKGVVLRIHEKHENPLKTVYEIKYETEPDWKYYLELLQDYEKGWLRVDD